MKLLIVEDEPDLARALQRALVDERFAVDVALDGDEAQYFLDDGIYDVVVLDLLVPKRSGWALLDGLRRAGSRTPVLVLTARDGIEDRVRALNLGADDYLIKPFAVSELIARLGALVRRAAGEPAPIIVVGEVAVDRAARAVRRDGSPVQLTAREYAILELLFRRRGMLVTRTEICEHLYSHTSDVFSNVVDVHVAALRRKLGSGLIATRRGQGYIVDA